MVKTYFGYIRVSTPKQGYGVSLTEQREAIKRYADRNGISISCWFEEKETAAKRGRSVWNTMLRELKHENAQGVIIHKIDRSARNLKDWAELGELIDHGIDVQFAHESLDLYSRGGRLSADIQAVVAADFIRNLREETRKGFYGRLKQGLYPLQAPLGYLDNGRGKPKTPDPATAPLVIQAFDLYATGTYTLKTLLRELHKLGLRNKKGKLVSLNGISTILNNPFYMGIIRLRKTGETFPGIHEPLISTTTFSRVQDILTGKYNARVRKHAFLFRRMLTCATCRYSLYGEQQKAFIYYRCHTKVCPTTGLREETVDGYVQTALASVELTKRELAALYQRVEKLKQRATKKLHDTVTALELNHGHLNERLDRLTDAYIDKLIEKNVFEQRRLALLTDIKALEEKQGKLQRTPHVVPERLRQYLEQAKNAHSVYVVANPGEKRDLLTSMTSNRLVEGKKVAIQLRPVFQALADREKSSCCDPHRGGSRIDFDKLFSKLVHCAATDTACTAN